MQWYYAVGDQRHGPVEQAEFDRLVSAGTITGATLVWRAGMAQWQPYSVGGGATETGTATATVDDGTEVCAVSGKRYPRREMINYEGKWISAEHRDTYFQRMREGVAQPGDGAVPGPFGYGGFWRRFCARFVDGLILQAIGYPVGLLVRAAMGSSAGSQMVVQLVAMGIGFGINMIYEAFFVSKFDATPGKMAMGLKIFRPDGSKLTFARAAGRYLGTIVSAIPLGIGYIMAASDDEKRALHDRICDTRVIKTR